jgi:type IV secretion system protein VirB5
MKLKQVAVCAALFAAVCVGPIAQAQLMTFTVADTTATINQIETLMQWADQFKKWKDQYDQMEKTIDQGKQTYSAITGSRGMGNIMNSPDLKNMLPAEWGNVLNTVKGTGEFSTERAKYPNDPSRPKLMVMYDTLAANSANFSTEFKRTQQRISNVQSLMSQIDGASDPAAKQDLTNRLVSEQNAIAAATQQTQVQKAKFEADMQVAQAGAQREFTCKEFKRC